MIDLYHSRRNRYKLCFLYEKCEDSPLDAYVIGKEPTDIFYAREAKRDKSGQVIQNAFAVSRSELTLETEDTLRNVEEGSIVVYMGEIWVVDSIEQDIHQKETQFSTENHYTTYLNIRR